MPLAVAKQCDSDKVTVTVPSLKSRFDSEIPWVLAAKLSSMPLPEKYDIRPLHRLLVLFFDMPQSNTPPITIIAESSLH